MANVRVNLDTKEFPYNFRELGATVVISTTLDATNPPSCGAYYLDNILPISRGFASAAFTAHIPSIISIPSTVLSCRRITASDGSLAYLAITIDSIYVFDTLGPNWRYLIPIVPSSLPTFALVKGEYYIFLPGDFKIMHYDFQLGVLTEVFTTGLDLTEIAGIAGAGDRMILWTAGRILWSSIFDPLDFVPSLTTGAGSTSVLAIDSVITLCLSLGSDFIIYTAANAVAARRTNDFNNPYTFDGIKGSAGVTDSRHVAENSNNAVHIVWTASGFQQVTVQEATYIFTELSDGIARAIITSVLPSTQQPSLTRSSALNVAVTFSSNRLLCISTGLASLDYYTDAYILDTALGRWGKLTANHSTFLNYWPVALANVITYAEIPALVPTYDDFSLPYYAYGVNEVLIPSIPGDNFGIVTPEGAILTVAPNDTANYRGALVGLVAATPRLYLGKFKLAASEGALVHSVVLTDLHAGQVILHGHGQNGEFSQRVTGLAQDPRMPGVWFGNISANAVSLEITGTFTLTDLSLAIERTGSINQFSPDTYTDRQIVVGDLDVINGSLRTLYHPPTNPSTTVPQSS